jgi:NADH-quinone oxidoreductase subunit M
MTDHFSILSLLIFLPLLGGLFLLPLNGRPSLARWLALAIAGLEFGLVVLVTLRTPAQGVGSLPGGYFLMEDRAWIPTFGIRYLVGMDGISYLMALLTAFITPLAIFTSWRSIRERVGCHFALILFLEGSIMGIFLSMDLVLFYLFWEAMLIPMFLLIGVWGHGNRIRSALKFFLFTFSGSVLMLLGIIGLHLVHLAQTGKATFALPELIGTRFPPGLEGWLCAAFLLAFAVKAPLVPFHTWLPDAHTDAPTAGSVDLAGLLLKTGAYGFIRFAWPLFPHAAARLTPLLYLVAVVGIIYGSWIAYAQTDMKRLVAYSSISHMGFVMLGIAAWTPVSLTGSVLQMVNHGVTTGALFALVGMLGERTGTREISAFGGLWGRAPFLSGLFLFFAMASAGLPGLNNFVGEFLILAGSFRAVPLVTVIAFLGVLLPLIYTVRLTQQVLFVTPRSDFSLSDISQRELVILGSLALVDLYLGVHPILLLNLLKGPVALLTGGVP